MYILDIITNPPIISSPPNSFEADSQIVTFPPFKIPFARAFPIIMAGLPTWWVFSQLSLSFYRKFHNQILDVLSRKLSSTVSFTLVTVIRNIQ